MQEAQLSPGVVARVAGKVAGVAFPPTDIGSVVIDNIVGAPLASDVLPGMEQRDLNAKVRDIMKTRKASIRSKGLDPGSPGWSEIDNLTLKDVLARRKKGLPGYDTIWKLLTSRRFQK